MQNTFDEEQIAANRKRAMTAGDDGAAFLLNLVAEELAERLTAIERKFPEAVELHGFTGITAEKLVQTGKVGTIKRVESPALGTAPDVTASLEHVPLEPQSVNLIVSPLAAHLTNDTPGLFIQALRALKPDGLFMAAIPATGTLAELREVLLAAEDELYGGASARVIPFADIRDFGGLLQRAGFALPVVDSETYTVRYDSLFPLMRDLRNMGMSNPLVSRSRKPVSKRFFMRAAEIYAERFSDPDGRIRATFSIVYISGWAPHESQQKPLRPGSANVSLEEAIKAVRKS
ncbi:methyltransferase domain-containing protein [Rhizobium sp. L1K21]|uniref:methyltransferase domain-containing protein n=1 Tax=Rhizobium sp. L1K21 TaxID=2954933 RepID=UPI002093C185|nr:methyltransferase domain-containing protein [Rhizobium sp. L1K21]MCO6188201.1 methyltransferase domain-containing protein [Rhizobium sp. L1K21]